MTATQKIDVARAAGYTVHAAQDNAQGFAFCIDGDYSSEFATEAEAWDGAVAEYSGNRITKLIAEQFGMSTNLIEPTSRLIEDLGADSLDQIEVVMAVEDEFALNVPDPVHEAWKTVQDVIDYVNTHTG